MVDRTEQLIYELIKPWCGRNWLTRRTPELTGETSLNMTLNLDPEDAAELLVMLFKEFGLNPDDVDLNVYYPRRRGEEIPLTIDMLIYSVRSGKWLYK
ncbi:DUF1493 family protein [Cronobacter sp. EKM101R]|uniref:DUF1493 family protein n=1 Tax=Cronobacter TaxID=413496 RepID=UPI0013EA70A2|nr:MULTISPECIES: DUF1493 family protein [Cronobacter]KAF6590697.1 DUF1493 family protein [Cronobacter sp. EKM101R]KAF6593160.1 DUF1493 family protein [Cronobacter sp. EKM102R]MDK1186938.1 DUF1493 family protein [Cronobacter turicensis]MDK1191340.1 DUF1493 family protein [Cronobacter dublinensis]MDK1201979.1 DUF1493 family protein [Cronobacter dublinensis]